jgi:cytochrome c
MSSSKITLLACGWVAALSIAAGWFSDPAYAQQTALKAGSASMFAGIGRPATPKELAAWDIDVRPDFKGLPPGAGSVAKGMEVWESKCASCHGVFGESNEVFSPIVGGTTKKDIAAGVTARLTDASFPGRTTMMKLASVSTLWDYINRAMPWNQPKSLSVEEVYAVTAYILNLAEVVPDDFVLSDRNIGQVQARLPNRNGMTTNHALWPGRSMGNQARPDVQASACMRNCSAEPTLSSFLPDFARNQHGNLAEQNRLVGAQVGADTSKPAASKPSSGIRTSAAEPTKGNPVMALLQKHTCTACHGVNNRIVGPGFNEVAAKYSGRADAVAYLAGKTKSGGQGVWGSIPMPPQALSEEDAKVIAAWIAAGASR